MLTGRCDDPDCSCRSPELQWFTDQVLRRDATRTDYMIIPLIAGVMARCILADDSRADSDADDAALRRQAGSVVALADRGRTESWESDLHAYGILADLVFCNWPAVMSWGGVSYERVTLGLPFGAPADQRMTAAVRFLGAQPPPSLTESVIVAVMTLVAAGGKHSEMPLLGKPGRRLRVVLADRLRREGLVTWPKILAAAVDDWTLATLERLARHNAAAGDAAIHYVIDLTQRSAGAQVAEQASALDRGEIDGASNDALPVEGKAAGVEASETEAAERLVEDAVAEIKFWRSQRDAVQQERDTFAQRDARSRSRVESLERQLAAERVRRQVLERELAELHRERDRYVERMAAEEALLDDAPPPPTDVFAGKRVLFFTGLESADTRAALAHGFWDLGAAQVDTYWTDKTRGPDVFPADAIIAMDVSHMSHATWNALIDKAKAAGAWCYWGKHGATTMARATAAAWGKRREREQRD